MQSRLWSKSTADLDLARDQSYIITQLLIYGTLSDLEWLKRHYPLKAIRDVYAQLKPERLPPEAKVFLDLFLGMT